MRLAAAAGFAVVAACSFDHGVVAQGDASCRRSGTPWWDPQYDYRYRIDTAGAPPGYTLTVDSKSLERFFGGEGYEPVRVVVDHTTVIDRVFEEYPRMTFKVPASGELWVYAGFLVNDYLEPEDPANVFTFAEDFDTYDGLARFDLQPPGDWAREEIPGPWSPNGVLRVTGASRHPAAIKNLTLADGEISVSVRFLAGTGQQHNGLAARSKSMQPATMDGFVGQLQADVQHARIAEYTDGVSPPAELSVMNRVIDRNRWYRVKLRFVGDVVTLSIDGTVVLTTTKSGSDGNLLGLFAHDCDVQFDGVRVRPAVDPEPIGTLGPEERYCD